MLELQSTRTRMRSFAIKARTMPLQYLSIPGTHARCVVRPDGTFICAGVHNARRVTSAVAMLHRDTLTRDDRRNLALAGRHYDPNLNTPIP